MDDGTKLATGGDDIKLWDVATSSIPTHQFTPHSSGISSLCWSHNNQILASAGSSGDKVVLTFVKNTASNIVEIAVGEQQTCVAFNSTSRYLLTGGKNHIVSIWDLKSRKLKKTYNGHRDTVTYTTFNWNDTYIASGSSSGEILLHNVVSGQASSPLITPKVQSIRGLEYSQFKKSLLASVTDDGSLSMWDTNTRKPLSTFRDAHRAPATALAFSPVNDMLLMSTGLDKRIVCYDVLGKSIIKSMTVESPLTSIACMHDGATLVVGSTRGKVYMFDLRMGSTPINVLNSHKSSVQCVTFQHGPTAKNNGVSSKTVKPAQAASVGRKLPQLNQGVSNVINPDIETGKSSDRLKSPGEDRENHDIISPIREGSVTTVKFNDSASHSGRPDTVGKALVTQSQKNDNLPDFFSPLSENTANISARRTPIGSVELELQTSFTTPQSITKNVTNDGPVYRDAGITSSTSVSPSSSHTTSSQPTATNNKPSPTYMHLPPSSTPGVTSPERQRSQSLTSQTISLSGGANPMRIFEVDLLKSPESESVQVRGISSSPGANRTLERGMLADLDSKPLGTPQCRRSNSPGRGLLGGSSDLATPKVKNGDLGSLGHPSKDEALRITEGTVLQPFQVQFIKNMIDDSLEDFKQSFHREILHLQREMVRQFQIQQVETQVMLEKYSVNEGLLIELERLREENKKLKATY